LDQLAPKSAILDVGCGYGRLLQAPALHQHRVIGVDGALGMLRRARVEGVQSPLALMNSTALGLADGYFDLVLIVAVLTAVAFEPAARATLAEAWRVLRPGGRLYIADFLIDPTPERQQRYAYGMQEFGVWGMFRLDEPPSGVVRHWEPADLRRLLKDFHITDWQEQTGRTMYGNLVRSITLVATKLDG
jgi:ubiquinone/menaquinone biosynthesis C-methylase UbiE